MRVTFKIEKACCRGTAPRLELEENRGLAAAGSARE
jgi:hypothetical protein